MTSRALSRPDALVIGLGAMGSAVAYQLAKQGANVVGIDRFNPPHKMGSTHGDTRITRQAIGEGRQFVPLALRSHELWREIERETDRALLTQCGGLILARSGLASHMHEQHDFFGNTISAAKEFNIAHQTLDAQAIAARYPQLILAGDETAYFEPGAGYLDPEACVSAQLELAARHGATLNTDERVLAIETTGGDTVVHTTRSRYVPGTTIVSAGPWLPALLPQFAQQLVVRRQVMYFFAIEDDAHYGAGNDGRDASAAGANPFPIFIWHWGAGANDVFYGFPYVSPVAGVRAVKLATEQCHAATTADEVNREIGSDEITAMLSQHIHGRLRGVTANCVKASTCLYTNAPGANFLIDRLPEANNVIVVSACSGHGFKHSAAIGEAVASMALTGNKPDVLMPFSMPNR